MLTSKKRFISLRKQSKLESFSSFEVEERLKIWSTQSHFITLMRSKKIEQIPFSNQQTVLFIRALLIIKRGCSKTDPRKYKNLIYSYTQAYCRVCIRFFYFEKVLSAYNLIYF